jgi:hypothetical protein
VATTSAPATASATLDAPRPPGGHQGVDLGLAAVVAGDVVAGLDEVAGHRAAHDAQPDEGDGGHGALPSRELRLRRPARASGRPARPGAGPALAREPGEAVHRGHGRLVLQPDPAGVAGLLEPGQVAVEVELAGARLAAAGGVGDLDVRDLAA